MCSGPHAAQVVIGGRNKYMINGHNAQQSQVQVPRLPPPLFSAQPALLLLGGA